MDILAVARSSTSSDRTCGLLLQMANRHGLIAGATGTGKTVTLQVLAEQFSRARSEEHTSELQSREKLVCRILLEKKNIIIKNDLKYITRQCRINTII